MLQARRQLMKLKQDLHHTKAEMDAQPQATMRFVTQRSVQPWTKPLLGENVKDQVFALYLPSVGMLRRDGILD